MSVRLRIFQIKYCSYYKINSLIVFEINSLIVFIYLFTKYLSNTGSKQLVHAYESVTCTNQQLFCSLIIWLLQRQCPNCLKNCLLIDPDTCRYQSKIRCLLHKADNRPYFNI